MSRHLDEKLYISYCVCESWRERLYLKQNTYFVSFMAIVVANLWKKFKLMENIERICQFHWAIAISLWIVQSIFVGKTMNPFVFSPNAFILLVKQPAGVFPILIQLIARWPPFLVTISAYGIDQIPSIPKKKEESNQCMSVCMGFTLFLAVCVCGRYVWMILISLRVPVADVLNYSYRVSSQICLNDPGSIRLSNWMLEISWCIITASVHPPFGCVHGVYL